MHVGQYAADELLMFAVLLRLVSRGFRHDEESSLACCTSEKGDVEVFDADFAQGLFLSIHNLFRVMNRETPELDHSGLFSVVATATMVPCSGLWCKATVLNALNKRILV